MGASFVLRASPFVSFTFILYRECEHPNKSLPSPADRTTRYNHYIRFLL